MHDIILTSYRLNGDTSSEKFQLYAISPLKQNNLEINAGDTITLSTNPVSEIVFYVWDLHDITTIKDYKPTVKHLFTTVPAISVGELYVVDQFDNRSPSTFFVIKSKAAIVPGIKISCENTSVVNDTVFSSTPVFQFIGKVTGLSGIKSCKINDTLCDKIITNTDGSFLFYDLFQNIDSLSPYQIIIQISDSFEKTVSDTMIVKYTQPGIFTPPVIKIANPSRDSSITPSQSTTVYGQISNASNYKNGAVFTYIGGNLQNGFTRINNQTFFREIKLDIGWNSILFKLFSDSTGQGNSLASKEIFIKFDPQATDTVSPKIVFVANGDTKLEDSIIVRTASMSLNIWVMDNSPLKSVFVNDVPAHINDSLPYLATINLKHLDNKIIIKATDNFDQSSELSFNSIKFNRLPVMTVDFTQKLFVADSAIIWKVSATDPDNDTLSVTALVNGIIIPMSSDGTILWRPSVKDTGWDTVKIEAYDKCDKIDTTFILNVAKRPDADVKVQWITNANNIPDTLIVGEDTLKCALTKNPLSNLGPFNYSIELSDIKKVIYNSSDSALRWIPGISDTGYHEIKFTIKDAKGNTDIFSDHIKIVPVIAGIRFESPTISTQESNSPVQIKVLMSRTINTAVTVNYDIDLTHTTASDQDFAPLTSGTVTFNPGEKSKTITLNIINDSVGEKDEQIALKLSKPSDNAKLENQSSTILTILDDDYVTYSFVSNQANGSESVRKCTLSVALSAPSVSTVTLSCQIDTQYTTASTSDYSFSKTTVTFTPGQTTATVLFEVSSDFKEETDEVVAFRLSSTSNNARPGSIILFKYTIDGRKEAVQINIDTPKFTDTEYRHDLNVQLRAGSLISSSVSVYFTIDKAASTADSGSDFIFLQSSPIVFQPNEWSKNITVRILDDQITEPQEKIIINLTKTSSGATLASEQTRSEIDILEND